MIAALFVARNGAYWNLPNVDPWDEKRDARKYAGPWPVVAHPPCASWCRLAGLREARWGLKRGEDGGCFESALHSVRTYGGVLEHPAHSDAWKAFGLTRPFPDRGWRGADRFGGLTCQVEQGHYGHRARKSTWLYAVGVDPIQLRWGPSQAVEWPAARGGTTGRGNAERMGRRERSATPPEFRDLLISIAESASARRVA